MESTDNKPIMAKFTAAEAVRIVSDNGAKCANFESGQTKAIHRDLFAPAIRAGLIPEESLEAPPEPEQPQLREEVVNNGLIEACTTLITRGNPGDFTKMGQPRTSAAKKLVDFDFTARELHDAFAEAMHRIDHGDDSTEHSEPSSSAAE